MEWGILAILSKRGCWYTPVLWEWKVLYCAARKTKKLPQKEYTIKDAVYDLAVLGGTKGAPSDGDPGVHSVWKGLEKLNILLTYRGFFI